MGVGTAPRDISPHLALEFPAVKMRCFPQAVLRAHEVPSSPPPAHVQVTAEALCANHRSQPPHLPDERAVRFLARQATAVCFRTSWKWRHGCDALCLVSFTQHSVSEVRARCLLVCLVPSGPFAEFCCPHRTPCVHLFPCGWTGRSGEHDHEHVCAGLFGDVRSSGS